MKKWRHLLKGGALIALMLLVMRPGVAKAVEPDIPQKQTFYLFNGDWKVSQDWYLPGVKSTKNVTNLKNSNKKVATVKPYKYAGEVFVGVTPRKPGKTTVSFTAKVNGKKKNYKCVVTVKKYVNPFSSLKVGSTSITKKFNNKTAIDISVNGTKKNQKVSFKLKKGWKLDWGGYYKAFDGSNNKVVKNGTKITVKKNRQLQFWLVNKDGSALCFLVCYN